MVWFLAPTVPLATQQFNVLKLQNPGVICRLITGADNVEAWSNTLVWGRILQNVKIVVSTYQILFDAATHGFVPLNSLSLIVVDEGLLSQQPPDTSMITNRSSTQLREKQRGRETHERAVLARQEQGPPSPSNPRTNS